MSSEYVPVVYDLMFCLSLIEVVPATLLIVTKSWEVIKEEPVLSIPIVSIFRSMIFPLGTEIVWDEPSRYRIVPVPVVVWFLASRSIF